MWFEFILTLATFITFIVTVVDWLMFRPQRKAALARGDADGAILPAWIDYSKSFFPILLVVLLLRSFVAEPYRIPSGSLEPTLRIGDFILVNKFSYGLRLPVSHTKILALGEPQRGDIAVFRFPPNPTINYIKRIVGLPGDHISYINKVLYVNGKEAPQEVQGHAVDSSNFCYVTQKQEDFFGIKHDIYVCPKLPAKDIKDIVVPEGHYFGMGDNRDDSFDSRTWGFIPEENLVGKATWVWFSWAGMNDMSWASAKESVRWQRVGERIQ